MNGKKFTGSITHFEARDIIFVKMGLDMSLFDSVCLAFKGCPVAIFKLKQMIDIDTLYPVQSFEWERTYRYGQGTKTDVIRCKIRGIRLQGSDPTSDAFGGYTDQGERWIKVEGMEFEVPEIMITNWLNLYTEVLTDLEEERFDKSPGAPFSGTGVYAAKVKLTEGTEIPNLVPMDGKRVKLYYRGIDKQCSNCFGTHGRGNCKNEKITWLEYVFNFICANPDIPRSYYGKWIDIVQEKIGELPSFEEEYGSNEDGMVEGTEGDRAYDTEDMDGMEDSQNGTEEERPEREGHNSEAKKKTGVRKSRGICHTIFEKPLW